MLGLIVSPSQDSQTESLAKGDFSEISAAEIWEKSRDFGFHIRQQG